MQKCTKPQTSLLHRAGHKHFQRTPNIHPWRGVLVGTRRRWATPSLRRRHRSSSSYTCRVWSAALVPSRRPSEGRQVTPADHLNPTCGRSGVSLAASPRPRQPPPPLQGRWLSRCPWSAWPAPRSGAGSPSTRGAGGTLPRGRPAPRVRHWPGRVWIKRGLSGGKPPAPKCSFQTSPPLVQKRRCFTTLVVTAHP